MAVEPESVSDETVRLNEWLGSFEVDAPTRRIDFEWIVSAVDQAAPGVYFPLGRADVASRSFIRVGEDGVWRCYGKDHFPRLVLQEILLERGYTLVHAAALTYRGVGVLIYGRGGVGKSSTVLGALGNADMGVLGDDYAIASRDGTLFGIPKRMAIYPYHWPLLPPDVRRRLRLLHGPSLTLATIAKLGPLRPYIRRVKNRLMASPVRFGRAFAETVSTAYASVPLEDVFGPRIEKETKVGLTVMLERGNDWNISELDIAAATNFMVAVNYAELGLTEPLFRYGQAGALSVSSHIGRAAEVCTGFLQRSPSALAVRVPADARPAEIQAKLIEVIQQYC